MSEDWKPKLAAIDLKTLPLEADEGFFVSRVDGQTTVEELALLTGLPRVRVAEIVEKLVATGALIAPPPADDLELDLAHVVPPPRLAPTVADGLPPLVRTEAEAPDTEEEPAESEAVRGSHLRLYQAEFHTLPAGERARLASLERGARLSALCFDPLPAVIQAILRNPNTGPEQARLIAGHHRTASGLEWLVLRADLMRDAQVQRLLYRNPQLNEGQLRRLLATKRLLDIWKLTVSREATTQTRTSTGRILRTKFTTAPAEEKVELIFTTEGRALGGLAGIPVDGKTSALLCGRTYASQMLVQNISHWAAAPPPLIAHLLKQPLVVRTPQLRNALSRHPNAPASVKRGG